MKKYTFYIIAALALGLASCSESDDTWDPYTNWAQRNAAWYASVADTARQAIREARAQYGDEWEAHTPWRMMKSLQLAADYDTRRVDDSICVKILASGPHAGDAAYMPMFTDSVRLSYRGWLMPTQYEAGGMVEQRVFTQTYYGSFDPATAAPSQMGVSGTIEGFATALQYMTAGDDWLVYIPQRMAYGEKASDAIPAYSTLLYRLTMVDHFPAGTTVPTWKARRK